MIPLHGSSAPTSSLVTIVLRDALLVTLFMQMTGTLGIQAHMQNMAIPAWARQATQRYRKEKKVTLWNMNSQALFRQVNVWFVICINLIFLWIRFLVIRCGIMNRMLHICGLKNKDTQAMQKCMKFLKGTLKGQLFVAFGQILNFWKKYQNLIRS